MKLSFEAQVAAGIWTSVFVLFGVILIVAKLNGV